jgi:hypothetical protein
VVETTGMATSSSKPVKVARKSLVLRVLALGKLISSSVLNELLYQVQWQEPGVLRLKFR